jgi:ABC-type uncharacterized transport system substrate-binding protein
MVSVVAGIPLMGFPNVRASPPLLNPSSSRKVPICKGEMCSMLGASSVDEFAVAFATLVQDRVGALIIGTDTYFYSEMSRLASLAMQHALPAVGPLRDFPTAGGLMSYSASIPTVHRQAGVYTGKVLNGTKPLDLPVLQPTRFELVINLKTPKTLGLTHITSGRRRGHRMSMRTERLRGDESTACN